MAKALALILLAPVLVLGQQCSIGGECIGYSIKRSSVHSERKCLEFCQSTASCEWYTFNPLNGFCNALLNCMHVDQSCSTCISGENDCRIDPVCNAPGSCSGVFLDHVNTPTPEDCLKSCQDNHQYCNWYSYYDKTRVCSLFVTCDLDETQTDAVSGETDCLVPLDCFVPGDCSGLYIDHINTPTKEGCLEACYEDYPRCNWFSYYDSGLCTLYETCTVDSTETGVVSGEKRCYLSYNVPTKMLMQASYNTSWIHMPSSLEDGLSCSLPPAYPIKVYGAVSQVIDGKATFCGGFYSRDFSECFSLNASTNSWVEFTELDIPRGYAASVMSPEGWWVAGGRSDINSVSTILYVGSAWTPGPDLPSIRHGHCMVQVNDTHTFMSGGYNGDTSDYLDDAYIFDWTTKVWTELAPMNKERDNFPCAFFRDGQGVPYVLTVDYNDVEALNLATLVWETFPAPPTTIRFGSFVQDGRDLLLVNQYEQNVLQFNIFDKTFRVVEGLTVPLMDNGLAVLPVSDRLMHGCA